MSYPDTLPAEEPGEDQRRIGDIWQRLGLSGLFFGTDGSHRQAFIYAYAVAALLVTAINTLNVMSILHDMPHLNPLEPLIWEGSSWLTLLAFFWIVWLAWRLAPFNVRPRWLLLIHIPAALVFASAHVGSFIACASSLIGCWAGTTMSAISGPNFSMSCARMALAI